MTTEEKFDLIIKKLTSLEEGQKSLEKGQDSLFKGQKSLEKGQDSLFKGQKGLELGLNSLRQDFLEFKNETDQNFEITNKLINQAFEKISENISYQDKVIQIEKIIHSRQRNFT